MKKSTWCSCPVCRSGRCGICRPGAVSDFPTLDHGLIKAERDFLKLDIVDWNRLNGYWKNTDAALHTIASWFIGHTHYTTMKADIHDAPHRDDFPGWKHAGYHEDDGRLYWNWFHHNQEGTLYFSDSPDFYGTLGNNSFWGDIGKVSAIGLALAQKQMGAHDVWISVINDERQIILEPLLSIADLYDSWLSGKTSEPVAAPAGIEQLRMF